MIYKIHKGYNRITGVSYPIKSKTGPWFASCCGASYQTLYNLDGSRNNKKNTINRKGITIYDGIIGGKRKGRANTVDHIKTRNGDLTVVIRGEW